MNNTSYSSFIGITIKAAIYQDDVVYQPDIHHLTCLIKLMGQPVVFLAWAYVPRRMVMT